MRFVPNATVFAILAASLIATGCGLGVSSRTHRTSSPADRIDPFEYGDEFQSSAPSADNRPLPASPDTLQINPPENSRTNQPYSITERARSGATGSERYLIQLGGVFDDKEEADAFANKARQKLQTTITVEYRAPFYRVFSDRYGNLAEAEKRVLTFKEMGFPDARWILNSTFSQ